MNIANRILTSLLLIATAAASAQEADTGRDLVDAFVNDVATLSSRFEQTLLDADGSLKDSYAIDQSPYEHLDTFNELAKRNAERVYREMEFD